MQMLNVIMNLPWKNVAKSAVVTVAAVAGWNVVMAIVETVKRSTAQPLLPDGGKKTAEDTRIDELTAKLAEAQTMLATFVAKETAVAGLAREVADNATEKARAVSALSGSAVKVPESRISDLEAARAARLAKEAKDAEEAKKAVETHVSVGAGADCHDELDRPIAPV